MPEPSAPSAPGSDRPAASAADETATAHAPFSWPARIALAAAAGLVVGGAAFTANGVAAALTPTVTSPGAAEDGDTAPSERRTIALTGTDQPEEPEPEPGGEQGAGHAGAAPAQGSDGTGGAGGTGGASGGGPAPGTPAEGDPGWVDPRGEILHGILNTPQDRPPLEPLITQEELDAEREAAEAGAEGPDAHG